MRQHGLLSAGLVLLGSLAGACVPFPHYYTKTPAVDGAVHRGETPVAGAAVYLELWPHGAGCTGTQDVSTTTDAEGRFHFDRIRKFSPVLTMDPVEVWQLCIVDGGRTDRGWYVNRVGGAAETVVMDCALDGGRPAAPDASGEAPGGVCTPRSPDGP